jgi:hypothetical protein
MVPVRKALEKILGSHEPFPAVIVDRRRDLVTGNRPAMSLLSEGVADQLLTPPVNALRVSLHPEGLAPRIANFDEYSTHLLERLDRQVALSGDADLAALGDELRGYPGVHHDPAPVAEPAALLFVPLVLRSEDGAELTFFSTLATFGTALDATVAELAIESFSLLTRRPSKPCVLRSADLVCQLC